MPIKKRNSLQAGPFLFSILQSDNDFKILENFDCGDSDLNEFFRKDAILYRHELFAETYALKYKFERKYILVAAISFNNDLIKLSQLEKEKNLPPQQARFTYSPAVKIGRLGVPLIYQGKNIGTWLLNMTKTLFVTNNRTGCRFLTVDAYNKPNVLRFYQKNDFTLLHDKDTKKNTRIMYFDLKRFIRGEKDIL